ncbi:Manganese transport regulator [Anaerohalosphaera lusitana]|uniref:Transcriptional regulator MntR n=1 Tax=Anaerohalosphaera lusitana TaxID=1936003 RepID=A0A1U9NNR5_9BACT|nr:metal-dependent transcriptional regulator [Anaerohalosphaera lusitana]AQT69368.1 Manganese transport regulator [Anaerohalosphaera lusitana]
MSPTTDYNLTASLEDYLEAIFNISAKGSVARSKDIAQMLDVSPASVTGALRTLAEKELVNYKPYGLVTLTPEGENEARRIVHKHNIIKLFFVDILGIDHNTAQQAACEAEHSFGPKIINKLVSFVEFFSRQSSQGTDLVKQFREFCNANDVGETIKEASNG